MVTTLEHKLLPSVEQLKAGLKEIKSHKGKEPQDVKLKELARSFSAHHEWDLATEALQLVVDEEERNLLIADLIEYFLLPAHEMEQAKKLAKYLTPTPEIQALVWIRIALAEQDPRKAQQLADKLPSPFSRNFAYLQILESYLLDNQKEKAHEIGQLMVKNARTIYDIKSRSYVLRQIAIDVFFAHHDKEEAKEIALLIPDEGIRNQVLNKIGH